LPGPLGSARLRQRLKRQRRRAGFAWRTIIAAVLVFGASGGSSGLGWFIYERKNELAIPSVFAGLLTVIMIGLFMEHLIFRTVENRTVKRGHAKLRRPPQ
jgi:ABC-type nitrate/sulfonate/bicarbonate transport system permease component